MLIAIENVKVNDIVQFEGQKYRVSEVLHRNSCRYVRLTLRHVENQKFEFLDGIMCKAKVEVVA